MTDNQTSSEDMPGKVTSEPAACRPSLAKRVAHLESGLELAHEEIARLRNAIGAAIEANAALAEMVALRVNPAGVEIPRDVVAQAEESARTAQIYSRPIPDPRPDRERAELDAIWEEMGRDHHEFLVTQGVIKEAPGQNEERQ